MSIVDSINCDGSATGYSSWLGSRITVVATSQTTGTVTISPGFAFNYIKTTLSRSSGSVSPSEETSSSFTYKCNGETTGILTITAYVEHKDVDIKVSINDEDKGTATALPTPRWISNLDENEQFTITANAKQGYRIKKIDYNEINYNGTEDYDQDGSNRVYHSYEYYHIDPNYTYGYQSPLTQYVYFDFAWVQVFAKTYDDTYQTSLQGGTASVSGVVGSMNFIKVGNSCVLTATPSEGYRFDRWTCEGVDSPPTKGRQYPSFTWEVPVDVTPSYYDEGRWAQYVVTWTAHFVKTWNVTTSVNINGCATVSLSPDPPNDDGTYDDGDVITATATPADNCTVLGLIEWNSWSSTDSKKRKKGRAYIHQSPWSGITVKEDLNIRAEAEPNDGRILCNHRMYIQGRVLIGDKPGSASAGKILCRETPDQ